MSKVSLPITNDFCPQTLFLYGTNKEDGTSDFGLFCWFSYQWDETLGVMLCIGGNKLTRDRIHAEGIFSANLVTEAMLPLADYLGNTAGYSPDKMRVAPQVERGRVLDVPVLTCSPLAFELEVDASLPRRDGEVFLCKIRNVLAEEALTDASVPLEERMRRIAPVSTTCSTYFGWDGRVLGAWGEPQQRLTLPRP